MANMAKSKAATVKAYLDALPEDRRKEIFKVRSVIHKHLPSGYEEAMTYGAITYQVPLKTLPNTYNGQPLCYVALAAQKNFNTLYLMGPYGNPTQRKQLEEAFKKSGKKLDMGKSCVHFKTAGDLPLEEIGKLIAAIPVANYVRAYEQSRAKK